MMYRGYKIEIGETGRYFIFKDDVKVYSMTSTEDEMHAWIDRAIRDQPSAVLPSVVEVDSIIQIVPPHKWGGCLAVVDEVKSFGCQAYVSIPWQDAMGHGVQDAYIRLNTDDFIDTGAKAIFVRDYETHVAGQADPLHLK